MQQSTVRGLNFVFSRLLCNIEQNASSHTLAVTSTLEFAKDISAKSVECN